MVTSATFLEACRREDPENTGRIISQLTDIVNLDMISAQIHPQGRGPKPFMHFVYLLKSDKDGGYYIGQTDDINRRVQQHLDGDVDATKSRLPVGLLYFEAYPTRTRAIQRELALKQFGSAYTGLLKRLGLK